MNQNQHPVGTIRTATSCTLEQAEAALSGLVDAGWTAPECDADDVVVVDAAMEPTTIDPDTLVIAHTDGACSGNPGPGGWGVVFSQDGRVVGEHSGGHPDTTSNRMELTAVLETLRRVPPHAPLKIATDSRLVIGWLSENWKRKEPACAALCAEIDTLLVGRECQFEKVRGHQGVVLNERADKLAVAAIPR